MQAPRNIDDEPGFSEFRFDTTHWTAVIAAGGGTSETARRAFGELYAIYSRPIHHFIRRRGYSEPDAEDLVQEFFRSLLEKNHLAGVRRERGRFRSWLRASLRHFLANDWNHTHRLKREGGWEAVPLSDLEASGALDDPKLANRDSDLRFDREWALTLIGSVMTTLESELHGSNRSKQFELLGRYLLPDGSAENHAAVAEELGMQVGALKVAIHRLRLRYRALLKAEIAKTVASPGDIEDEIRHLMAVLRSDPPAENSG